MRIIIGNIISLVAALFLAASCLVKNKRGIFLCQFMECVLLAISSVFFGSLAGTTTLLLSAVRNLIVARERYTKQMMYIFLVLTIVAGILANSRGLLGLMPVIATVEYTICCYYITGIKAIRCSIFVNMAIWIVYSFLILDFSTAISDSIILIVDLAAIVKMHRSEKALLSEE